MAGQWSHFWLTIQSIRGLPEGYTDSKRTGKGSVSSLRPASDGWKAFPDCERSVWPRDQLKTILKAANRPQWWWMIDWLIEWMPNDIFSISEKKVLRGQNFPANRSVPRPTDDAEDVMVYPKLLASKENWFLFFDVPWLPQLGAPILRGSSCLRWTTAVFYPQLLGSPTCLNPIFGAQIAMVSR